MYTIYGLIDPLTRDLFYVGCTTNPEQRLRDHVRTKHGPAKNGRRVKLRIAQIRAAGYRPAMIILEHTPDVTRESVWITFFHPLGLVNTAHGYKQPKRAVGRPRIHPPRVKISARERAFKAWATKRAKALLKH